MDGGDSPEKLPAKASEGVEEIGWVRVKGNPAGSSPPSFPSFLSSLVIGHPRISPFLIRLTSPSFLSFIFNLYRPTSLPFNLGHMWLSRFCFKNQEHSRK